MTLPATCCQGLLSGLLLGVLVSVAAATGVAADTLRLAVVAPPDEDHLAWAAAMQLRRDAAQAQGIDMVVEPAAFADSAPLADLYVMPVRSLATQVPAFQVLELPFFYTSLEALHRRLDGALGEYLATAARKRGWEVLAYWDEGMHIFSGLKRYDRARNLKAREFLITRPDPVAEKQFRYWKADARRINPVDSEMVLRECVIASRGATRQEVLRERLYQVHFALSLTNHRYEGWVLLAPAAAWSRLDRVTGQKLAAIARDTSAWQRNDARRREAAALAELKTAGMTVYAVDADERDTFRHALPDWVELLPDELDVQEKRRLIDLASAGAATVAVPAGGPVSPDARRDPAPDTEDR